MTETPQPVPQPPAPDPNAEPGEATTIVSTDGTTTTITTPKP